MSDAAKAVHEALGAYLDEGEIAICWTLTIDVAGPDGRRYLAHRAGGGAEGDDGPTAWAALGMLRSSAQLAEKQLQDSTTDADGEEPDG